MSFSLRRNQNEYLFNHEHHPQHPLETSVHLRIYALQIGQCNFLVDHHLVKADYEEGVQEAFVEECQSYTPANEMEVTEMFRIYSRCGIDLKRVVIVCRILEEAINGVEHFVRQ